MANRTPAQQSPTYPLSTHLDEQQWHALYSDAYPWIDHSKELEYVVRAAWNAKNSGRWNDGLVTAKGVAREDEAEGYGEGDSGV